VCGIQLSGKVDAALQRWQNLLLTLFPEKSEGVSVKEVK